MESQASKLDIGIKYKVYKDECDLPPIRAMMEKALSEPYSIYTYRFFINNWPGLTWMAMDEGQCVGSVVAKLEDSRGVYRGYIAMLAVLPEYRGKGIAQTLVTRCIQSMKAYGCQDVMLETEVTNKAALNLYLKMGFIRDRRMRRYYLNGVDAWRLLLILDHRTPQLEPPTETFGEVSTSSPTSKTNRIVDSIPQVDRDEQNLIALNSMRSLRQLNLEAKIVALSLDEWKTDT